MTPSLREEVTGAQFSTYRIGGRLQEAYQPESPDEAVRLLESVQDRGVSLTVLGWGSNSIIATSGVSGVTLITRKLNWVKPIGETRFEFGAGMHLAKSATIAQQYGLTGGEYMIGIPGTIGGAVRMNAGALGQETAELVRSVHLYNMETGQRGTWERDQLGFGYRESNIDPTRHVILAAELEFTPGEIQTISETMAQSIAFRKAHHPTEPNAGSVFRNPSREWTAGRILDEAGAKTWQEGGVRVSPMHANFIINLGTGTSTDILKLMVRMKDAIAERCQQEGLLVSPHPENLLLGDITPEETLLWKELTGDSPR